VKTVAISPTGIAASGSSDESIKLFNLQKRVEIGTLLHHEGNHVVISPPGNDSFQSRLMFYSRCLFIYLFCQDISKLYWLSATTATKFCTMVEIILYFITPV